MRQLGQRPLDPFGLATVNIDVEGEATLTGPMRKILLLEDRGDFRQVLHDYLVLSHFEVTSVQSGIDGLRKIMEGSFDVIICDMLMPKMGGEMFYWAVTRARPATRNRFIFFTGHKNNPQLEFFFKRINATVLFKPFKLAALDSAIRDVAGKLGYKLV